eukprot:scaffold8472_cov106-Skeletonema_dohrnii-CCMP3373.AAC.2
MARQHNISRVKRREVRSGKWEVEARKFMSPELDSMSLRLFFVLTIPTSVLRCCSRGGKIKVPIFSTLDRISTLSKDYDGSGLSPLSCCCCDWFAVQAQITGTARLERSHGQGVEDAGCRECQHTGGVKK